MSKGKKKPYPLNFRQYGPIISSLAGRHGSMGITPSLSTLQIKFPQQGINE